MAKENNTDDVMINDYAVDDKEQPKTWLGDKGSHDSTRWEVLHKEPKDLYIQKQDYPL
jgi:hypothetical protein